MKISFVRRASRRAGFTLIEVLVTLLIMSGIMVAMTQILTAARHARDTIHNIQETQLAGPAILDLLERDIRGIVTYDRTRQIHLRVKNRVMLGMDADSIDFVTSTDSLSPISLDDRFVRSDMCEVGYRLRPNPESSDQFLEIYRRESFGIDEEPFEDGTFSYLHDRVKSFDIQCFAKDGKDEQPLDEWGADSNTENIGLPARIEVTLILELAPRLVNEQMTLLPTERRTITYRRIIRFAESLRVNEELIAVPMIPKAPAANGASGNNPNGTTNGAGTEVGGAAGGGGGGGAKRGGGSGRAEGGGGRGSGPAMPDPLLDAPR